MKDETPCALKPLVFGITSDQFDELDHLIHRLRAHGDVIASGGADELSKGSLLFIGEVIFEAASTVADIFDRIDEQTLEKTDKASSRAASMAGRPVFASKMHRDLLHARSIVQLMQTSAQQAEVEGLGGSCAGVSDLLGKVIAYVEVNFETSAQ